MNLDATTAQSTSRVLLSNATACQVLANIAVMQFYYGLNNYAYTYYDTYIWSSSDITTIWAVSSIR